MMARGEREQGEKDNKDVGRNYQLGFPVSRKHAGATSIHWSAILFFLLFPLYSVTFVAPHRSPVPRFGIAFRPPTWGRVLARWKRVSSSVHRLRGSAMMSRKNGLEKSANAGRFLKEGSFLAEEADYASKTGDFTKLVYHHGILSVTMRAGKTRRCRRRR